MNKRSRYFEWIAGEDAGEILTLESISEIDGEIIYNFDNGDSCNQRFISKVTGSEFDLKGKFMVEINSPANPWTIEDEKSKMYSDRSMSEPVEIPSLKDVVSNGQGISSGIVLVPPKGKQRLVELPSIEEYEIVPETLVQQPVIDEPAPEKVQSIQSPVDTKSDNSEKSVQDREDKTEPQSFDPIGILVGGCKKHPTEVQMSVTINLPSKTIYSIADAEFENGGDKFIDYVIKGVKVDMIIDSLKTALKESYSQVNADKE